MPGMGDYAVGALTSWQDAGGARWILAPSASKVTALKVTDSGLEKGWTSRDMVQPISPIVVNGVDLRSVGR